MMPQKSSQGQPSVIRQNQALGCLGFWPTDPPQSILCIRTVALLPKKTKPAFDAACLSGTQGQTRARFYTVAASSCHRPKISRLPLPLSGESSHAAPLFVMPRESTKKPLRLAKAHAAVLSKLRFSRRIDRVIEPSQRP